MNAPEISIFATVDDPRVSEIRKALRRVLLQLDLPLDWNEYVPGQKILPDFIKKTSPGSLVVNGKPTSFPAVSEHENWILQAIQGHGLQGRAAAKIKRKQIFKAYLSLLLNLVIAFFPKCPLCWTAYLSLIGLAGTYSIRYQPWLLSASVLLLVINLITIYQRRQRRGLMTFWVGFGASVLILANRLYFETPILLWLAVAALTLTALWSALDRRMESTLNFHLKRLRVGLSRH